MTQQASRREFLKRATALSGAGVATPWALSLAAMGEAAAQALPTDYKALVCVFLYGGNDYANTVVPYDLSHYNAYQSLRGATLATARDKLLALTPQTALPGSREYALAPELAPIAPLFNTSGKLGVLLNIGTLIEPVTKTQYINKSKRLPPKLFSHNDQQSVWQSSAAEGATSGWGGRMGDLFAAGNGNATFTNVSVTGNAVYLAGNTAVQYQVTPAGSVPITGIQNNLFGSAACAQTLRELITASSSHLFENEYNRVTSRSITADTALTAAIKPEYVFKTVFNPDGLSAQLKMVARMIAARDKLTAKRQVFFVSLGGFDTHDQLLDEHPVLLATVGGALKSFYDATEELGVANQVTTFTGSDFGRTLTTNGNGSDHGWGSMHFVLGGAVKGKNFYGQAPEVANDGTNDVGQGRLLPSTSVDQLAATLATWFGVKPGQLKDVLPNIDNFSAQSNGGKYLDFFV
jgi:uncharacterized protein (DUF1501 family)